MNEITIKNSKIVQRSDSYIYQIQCNYEYIWCVHMVDCNQNEFGCSPQTAHSHRHI